MSRKGGPIAWMTNNHVTSNLVMLFLLIGGLLSLNVIRQEVFPEIESETVQIYVSYPGASPEEIENGIVQPIENAISGLDGIKEITSTANENSASILAELVSGTDQRKALQNIKDEVDGLTTLPDDSETPVVKMVSRKRHVVSLILYGAVTDKVLHHTAEMIKDTLLDNKLISQIEFRGIREYEISIEVSQENLRRYNTTLSALADTISSSTIELPGGGIKTRGGEILLRVNERRDYGRQFAELPVITTSGGSVIKLGDIATINDGYEDTDYFGLYNNKPSVEIQVYSLESEKPIEVADAAKDMIPEISKGLPPGMKLEVRYDRSKIFKQRIELLLKNGILGLLLVIVILGIFLEFRLAFWVMMGIPISFLGSLLFLPALGTSINMITLFAYIIALGIVVDDAIVIGENIYHYRQKGMDAIEASIKGARELAVPVTFSILTNIVAFMPLYYIPGVMGKIFGMIPVIVITAFIISLFESLFILPAHLAHSHRSARTGIGASIHNLQQKFSTGFHSWVRNRFGPFLRFTLHHRYLTLLISISILIIAASYAASGRMGFSLFPRVESDYSRATLVMPYGTPIEKTLATAERIVKGAEKTIEQIGSDELVKGIFTQIGYGGSHNVSIRVFLADPEIREKIMSNDEFTKKWRRNVGLLPGIDYIKFQSDSGGPGSGSSITVQLNHRNISQLEKASSQLAFELSKFSMVKDINDGYQPGKEQLSFKISTEAKAMGLTSQYIAREIRNAYYGKKVLSQQRGKNELTVMLRLPEKERKSEYSIGNLVLISPSGKEVYLREIVKFERGRAYTEINHSNSRRVIQVEADVVPRHKTDEILAELTTKVLPGLIDKYPGLKYTFEGRQADIRESMSSLKKGFLIAMIAIFALLAIPFKSYFQPIIVMISIPFGIIGAIMGHLILGYPLSVMSMFGIVALAGVVVNDTLVLVDMANRLVRHDGIQIHRAIYDAAIQRFRPIILTTLTTFFGLVPMIAETSRQAKFLIPMAISLGFGILFATLITLVLVPSLYLILHDMKVMLGREEA